MTPSSWGIQPLRPCGLQVAEPPGDAYNPFSCMGVGLGDPPHERHRQLHGRGESSSKVLYITSERFTNEVIEAIQNRKTQSCGTAAGVDVLMVDDIQFIAGKTSTQEEFSTPSTICTRADHHLLGPPPKKSPPGGAAALPL